MISLPQTGTTCSESIDKMNHVVLINDHPFKGGIGKYVFHLYNEFLEIQPEHYSFQLLLQNVPSHASLESWTGWDPKTCDSLDMSVQYRPSWAKQRGFGKIYQLTSLYYFPKKIPVNFSLYHISSQMMGNSVRYVSPTVITCHDIIALRVRSNYSELARYLRAKHIASLVNASGIIFISEHTKNDFLTQFDYKEENTSVIHHGVSDTFQPRDKEVCREELRLPLNRPIILHIGTEEARKNTETILRAIHTLRKQDPAVLLVRIGGQSSRSRKLIEKLGLEKNTLYIQNQSELSIAHFYNAADVFVFPSTYEGFGLPVLEAMKSGCPVIASNATSIPEITGDAAVLLNPRDVNGFTKSIETILDDASLQIQMSKKGIERAHQFNWRKTALKTLDVYWKILNTS